MSTRRSRRAQRASCCTAPPGTGKTMLARAIAKASAANFIAVTAADIESKWYGEMQTRIDALFAHATSRAPCIIFIDEIDGLLPVRNPLDTHRSALVAHFLQAWEGLVSRRSQSAAASWVIIIGATNKRANIDPAALRRMVSVRGGWGRVGW